MKLHPNYLHPKTKAFLVTCILVVAGIIGVQHAGGTSRDIAEIAPLIVFYITLLFNTYPSIKLFSSITPMEDPLQKAIDIPLFLSYFFLAYALSSAPLFFIGVIFLFIFASLKYILLLGTIPHSRLIKKKIALDILGTLLGATTLVIYLFGLTIFSAWFMATLFVIANIVFLLIKPMYRLIDL